MTEPHADLTITSACSDDTRALGRALGRLLGGGEVLALAGDLGSGKTTFTKGLAEGLDVDPSVPVSSPTYVIEHIYQGRLVLHHYDVYRLASAAEFEDIGFAENVRPGHVLAIEWADKVREALPPDVLEVELSVAATKDVRADPGRRTIRASGRATCWADKLARLKSPCTISQGTRKTGGPDDRSP